MKNSIYSTTAGMLTSAERLNSISNNLANVNTNGYKTDVPFEQTIRFLAEGPYPGKDQPVLGGHKLDMKNGLISTTDRNLDVALDSPGFFVLEGPNNQPLLTRNGSFQINSKRELVSNDGYRVLDKFNTPITVYGDQVQISPGGDIVIDKAYFTTLKVVDVADRYNLKKVGNTFFTVKDPNQPPTDVENPSMIVGALEKSNVNLMEGITDLINVSRTFELQKTAADLILKMVRKSITDLPKPM